MSLFSIDYRRVIDSSFILESTSHRDARNQGNEILTHLEPLQPKLHKEVIWAEECRVGRVERINRESPKVFSIDYRRVIDCSFALEAERPAEARELARSILDRIEPTRPTLNKETIWTEECWVNGVVRRSDLDRPKEMKTWIWNGDNRYSS